MTLYWGLCTGETPPGCSCSGGGGPPPGGGTVYEDINLDTAWRQNEIQDVEGDPPCADSWSAGTAPQHYDWDTVGYESGASGTLPESMREDLYWTEGEAYDATMTASISVPFGGTIDVALQIGQATGTSDMTFSGSVVSWNDEPYSVPDPCDETTYGDTVTSEWQSPGGDARRVRSIVTWTASLVRSDERESGCCAASCGDPAVCYGTLRIEVNVAISLETEET